MFNTKEQQHLLPLNILLADDDSDDCHFFKEALKEFPISTHLTAVHDGEQLMQELTKETNELPHVLFLDLNMPRKNGFECLYEIKLNEKLKQLPVIIYSTSFHKSIADMLYKNGANYYISKPTEISQLKKVVQEMLSLIATNMYEGNAENLSQPVKENFVLSMERKNSKAFSWFNNFFVIPFEENLN
jgi:CheY-like chemotaxis protein